MVVFEVARVETTPIDGQKPGTSGLRKKVRFPIGCITFNGSIICTFELRLCHSDPYLIESVNLDATSDFFFLKLVFLYVEIRI